MYYDDYESEEKRQKRQHRRKVVADWKASAKAIREAEPHKKMLLREAKRESLARIEDAARTVEDFEKLLILWDNTEIVRYYLIDKREVANLDGMEDYELPEYDRVVPQPLDHVWWRKLMAGDFDDYIHDCPHEIHELTSSRPVHILTKALDDDHKEILYYWAIRQWSPQRIAAFRGQTDRNIRKVYNKMIEDIRMDLYIRLIGRYEAEAPLTPAQKHLCEYFTEQLDDKQRARLRKKMAKNTWRRSKRHE